MGLLSNQHFNIAPNFWDLGHSFFWILSGSTYQISSSWLWPDPEQLRDSPKTSGWAHHTAFSPSAFWGCSLLDKLSRFPAEAEVTKASVTATCFCYWIATFFFLIFLIKPICLLASWNTVWGSIVNIRPIKQTSEVSFTILRMHFAEATLQPDCNAHVFSIET